MCLPTNEPHWTESHKTKSRTVQPCWAADTEASNVVTCIGTLLDGPCVRGHTVLTHWLEGRMREQTRVEFVDCLGKGGGEGERGKGEGRGLEERAGRGRKGKEGGTPSAGVWWWVLAVRCAVVTSRVLILCLEPHPHFGMRRLPLLKSAHIHPLSWFPNDF